jgi:hypothetical protein
VSARQSIYIYLALTFLAGLLSGALPHHMASVAEAAWLIMSVVTPYVWFYLDAAERGFGRTYAWSAGVILFAVLAVPLYLFRSRPPGHRAKAIAKALSVLLLSVLLPILAAAFCALVFAKG